MKNLLELLKRFFFGQGGKAPSGAEDKPEDKKRKAPEKSYKNPENKGTSDELSPEEYVRHKILEEIAATRFF